MSSQTLHLSAGPRRRFSPLPCQSGDADLWFAERTADVERAKSLCRTCPVIAECLAGALDRREPWGVWGGEVFVDGLVAATKRGRGRPPRPGREAASAEPCVETAA